MGRPRVLQIGMDPAVIDFSAWPGQSAEALLARLEQARTELIDAGFDVTWCLLTDDVVEIGSGLRTAHAYTPIFEQVVNTVTAGRPGVPLCFNDSPETTLEAVQRVRR